MGFFNFFYLQTQQTCVKIKEQYKDGLLCMQVHCACSVWCRAVSAILFFVPVEATKHPRRVTDVWLYLTLHCQTVNHHNYPGALLTLKLNHWQRQHPRHPAFTIDKPVMQRSERRLGYLLCSLTYDKTVFIPLSREKERWSTFTKTTRHDRKR